MARRAVPLVLVVLLAAVAFSQTAGGGRLAFDINGYIVGKWRNADNGHVYAISGSGKTYALRAGASWTTSEGCQVNAGDLLYVLGAKQSVGGYLNGGDYTGPWRFLKKDDKGNCVWTGVAPDTQGYYEASSGFVPATGPKTAENPDGQYMNWFCAYTQPYTQCASLSRIGKGFVQGGAASGGGKPAAGGSGGAASRGTLRLSWTMPDRFGLDRNGDGLIDYPASAADVSPYRWPVSVVVRSCDSKATYTFASASGALAAEPDTEARPCGFHVYFPREGRYTLKATATWPDGSKAQGTAQVTVQDWLVVGLGDSAGSGEGVPDKPGATSAVWESERCHRSASSFEALTALQLERADPRTSVTFVHLACSGAGIKEGAVGPYFGIAPDGASQPLEAQVAEAKRLAGGREVDAVIVSIGVNDVGFGAIVQFCVAFQHCMSHPYQGKRTLDDVTQERLSRLPSLYAQLAAKLRTLAPPNRVYLTEYFDPTRDDTGQFCDSMVGVGLDEMGADEVRWAYERVLAPLNVAVARAAAANGWNLVSGAAGRFHDHGYCAGSDGWIVTLSQSLAGQGNKEGTLHPNREGHAQLASLAEPVVRRDLYPGGAARPPR